MKPCEIVTKAHFLRKGDNLCLLTQIGHHDPAIFANPSTYQFDRFIPERTGEAGPGLGATGDSVAGVAISRFFLHGHELRHPLIPFGASSSMCPGRFLAMYEVRMFVLAMLWHFEIEVEPATPPPSTDKGRVGTDVPPPLAKLPFRYRPRSSPPAL